MERGPGDEKVHLIVRKIQNQFALHVLHVLPQNRDGTIARKNVMNFQCRDNREYPHE